MVCCCRVVKGIGRSAPNGHLYVFGSEYFSTGRSVSVRREMSTDVRDIAVPATTNIVVETMTMGRRPGNLNSGCFVAIHSLRPLNRAPRQGYSYQYSPLPVTRHHRLAFRGRATRVNFQCWLFIIFASFFLDIVHIWFPSYCTHSIHVLLFKCGLT